MAYLGKITFVWLVIFGSLLAGYTLKRSGRVSDPGKMSGSIVRFAIRSLIPMVVGFAFWRMDLSNRRILTLPLFAAALSTIQLFLGIWMANLQGLDRQKKGSFVTCSMVSNVGYPLAGFLCFVLFGEIGFSLTVLYCLYFGPYLYTVTFYAAEHYSSEGRVRITDTLKNFFTDGIRLFPFLGIICGLALNLLGIERPESITTFNKVLVPMTTAVYLFGIGLTVRFSQLRHYRRECALISVIKFVISPIIGLGMGYLLGYHNILDGLVLKVVFLESAMPVGISVLMLPALFKLDQDLSNSCWIVTTVLLIPILPILLFILTFL